MAERKRKLFWLKPDQAVLAPNVGRVLGRLAHVGANHAEWRDQSLLHLVRPACGFRDRSEPGRTTAGRAVGRTFRPLESAENRWSAPSRHRSASGAYKGKRF